MASLRVPSTITLVFLVALASAQRLPEAIVETKVFHHPVSGPYVEVNTAILGASVAHDQAVGLDQAKVELLVIVEKDAAIVDFRKVEVLGPPRTGEIAPDFLHSETFALPSGEYSLEVQVRDLNGSDTAFVQKRVLAIGAISAPPVFSDILLIASAGPAREGMTTHNGQYMEPYIGTYFPREMPRLDLYTELYGMDRAVGPDSLYLLSYQLEVHGTGTVVGNFRNSVRLKARPVEPVLGGFDLAALTSGNYVLKVEARDRNGQLLATQDLFVQRNNPMNYDLAQLDALAMGNTFADRITEPDTLVEFVRCLVPIADDLERKIIMDRTRDHDADLSRRFLYSFWFNRNSADPEGSWVSYRDEVARVNRMYGTRIKRGYETDRGRVHLKYGAPNTVTDRSNEMDAYPYQIWHYYRAGRYTDRRFVFYLPDLVTNDYELLHSEVPGEVNNPRWNLMVHSRNTPQNNVQSTGVNSMSGERANDLFAIPR
ncbi:MAG: GWxTD domain-containing protein [Flavobacteriales bacterium]|nr:GWxTD domain-containing protein [Flavobacteriales bacterium]MBK9537910.1 GWxTD domain-containing protein [Flavobacteriales bacterium]